MLILSRNKSQSVIIGNKGDITITVISIGENHVKLGFTAEKDIPIHRLEIFQKLEMEKGLVVDETL